MKTAIYVRVSTDHQAMKQTIEQQVERLEQAIAEHDEWQLDAAHVYRDDGIRGATLKRPGLDRLREQAQLGTIEQVLITAPGALWARLARN